MDQRLHSFRNGLWFCQLFYATWMMGLVGLSSSFKLVRGEIRRMCVWGRGCVEIDKGPWVCYLPVSSR